MQVAHTGLMRSGGVTQGSAAQTEAAAKEKPDTPPAVVLFVVVIPFVVVRCSFLE